MLALSLLCLSLTSSTDIPPPPSSLAPKAGDAVLDDDAPPSDDGNDTETQTESVSPSTDNGIDTEASPESVPPSTNGGSDAETPPDAPVEGQAPPEQDTDTPATEGRGPGTVETPAEQPPPSGEADPPMQQGPALELIGSSVGGALAVGFIPVAATLAVAALNAAAYVLISRVLTNPPGQQGEPTYILLAPLLIAPPVAIVAAAMVFVGSVGSMALAAWLFDGPWLSAVLWQTAAALGAALLVASAGLTPIVALVMLGGFAAVASATWPDATEREQSQVLSVAFLAIGFAQVGWWAASATTAASALGVGALFAVGGLEVVLPDEE